MGAAWSKSRVICGSQVYTRRYKERDLEFIYRKVDDDVTTALHYRTVI